MVTKTNIIYITVTTIVLLIIVMIINVVIIININVAITFLLLEFDHQITTNIIINITFY